MLAANCTFADTGVGGFTSPAAGVDVEPGAPSNLLDGIRFVGCIASGNVGAGFNLSPGYGGASAKKNVTISFERCTHHVRGGLGQGFASGGGNPRWPMGRVDIKDCSVSKTAWSGISFRNAISGLHVSYSNITLTDVAIGWQRTRGAHSGTGKWPWWNASVGPPMQAWPIDLSHTSHDVTAPVGQLSITGLRAMDQLSRPFLHAETPRNLSLAQGGLRQILIEGVVQVKSAKQCEPVGIASSAEWGVDLGSLACSKHRAVASKSDDTSSLLPAWTGPQPCDESCSVKQPAMGFSAAPNTTHRYVFIASHKLGTYSLGPQPIHFGGLYIVAWCECSTRTRRHSFV
jgi:hypothetical protein